MNPTAVTAMVKLLESCHTADHWMVAADLIQELTTEERRQVREAATAAGLKNLPRNLYYNYQSGEWI